MAKQIKLTVTLTVIYDPLGTSASDLKEVLDDNIRRGVGNGMLTGNTEAEVDEWSLDIKQEPST